MDNQKKGALIGRRYEKIILLIFIAVITAIVTAVLVFVYKPNQNSLGALGSVCMDVISMIVLLILIVSFMFEKNEFDNTSRLFLGLMLVTNVALLFDFLTWAFDGSLAYGHLNYVFIVASLSLASILAAGFSLYLGSYMEEMYGLNMKIRVKICVVLNLLAFASTIISAIAQKAFDIVDGHYETGGLYDYITAIPVLTLVYMTIYSIIHIKIIGSHDVIAVVGYIFIMLCGVLIEDTFTVGATYVSVAIADILIFLMLQNKMLNRIEKQRKILSEKISDQYDKLASMAGIYSYVNDVDLKKMTAVRFDHEESGVEQLDFAKDSHTSLNKGLYEDIDERHKEKFLEFTDLATLSARMKGDKIISAEFHHKKDGWFRAQYIRIGELLDNQVSKVIYAIQNIDEEKKNVEKWIIRSNTDELTGFLNRHAYEEDIISLEKENIDDNFVYVSIDVNGLKVVNDTLGHEAGDELLVSACECMKQCFGDFGKLYRIGGDEFVALICADEETIEDIKQKMENLTINWEGKKFDNLALSCGYVMKKEPESTSLHQMAVLADKRMYEDKSKYYQKRGIDRRIRRDEAFDSGNKTDNSETERIDQELIEFFCKEYQAVWLINMSDFSIEIFTADESKCIENSVQSALALKKYDDARKWYIENMVVENHRERLLVSTSIDNILRMTMDGKQLNVEYGRISKGNINYNQLCYDVIRNEEGKAERVIMGFRDIDIRKRAEFDDLTGVLSRYAFLEKAEKLLEENSDEQFDIIISDIVDFKKVNETYGIKVADEILKWNGAYLMKVMSDNLLVGRYGSDQMVIFGAHDEFTKATSSLAGEQYNEAMRNNGLPEITTKFGVYNNVRHDQSVIASCDKAHLALNSIKYKYGVMLARYDDVLKDTIEKKSRIEKSMHTSLQNGDFKVYYQPKHDAKTGKLAGAEALIRWIHPEYGFMNPDDFIPLFETNGFIVENDRFVWDRTCENLNRWVNNGIATVPISVNFSKVTMSRVGVVDEMMSTARTYKVLPRQLHVEITETLMSENVPDLIDKLNAIREAGFEIELDDFGSGYTSINILSTLPLDIVKLDMSFMQQFGDEKRTKVLAACSSLAKDLGFKTVSEGVELKEQIEVLRDLGIDYIQGYYFSKPLPEEEFEKYLIANAN